MLRKLFPTLPVEEQERCVRNLYILSVMNYDELPAWCRDLLNSFFSQEGDICLDYMYEKTFLGRRLHKPSDPDMFIKWVSIYYRIEKDVKISLRDLSFSVKMFVRMPYKTSTLQKKISNAFFYPDELRDIDKCVLVNSDQ